MVPDGHRLRQFLHEQFVVSFAGPHIPAGHQHSPGLGRQPHRADNVIETHFRRLRVTRIIIIKIILKEK